MSRSRWEHFDWGLLAIAVLLSIIGLAMIYSATLGSKPWPAPGGARLSIQPLA